MSNKQMIEIKIPKGYMNCGISKDNYFIADTNNSKNWDTIRLPLPVPQFTNVWSINHYSDDFTIVYLEEIQEGNKEATMINKKTMNDNKARKYTSPILEELMSEITPEEMKSTEQKMLQELKEKNMKNKLLGFLDGLTLILLVWNTIYQFNQMNVDAGAGWLVATLYFTTTTMYKFKDKK